ncbi:MAG: CPBP family intramembrane glutamic endopeptidase [Methanomicrobiales archaeon]
MGLFLPLTYALYKKDWESLGFTKNNIVNALIIGIAAGFLVILYTFFLFGDGTPPNMLGLQLIVGIPVWFLIMSPFQEFFFRGLMQPKIQDFLGKWLGLVFTSLLFTLWHFFPPLEGTLTSTLPLSSPLGVVSTFMLGLLFGYTFNRTNNIIAPWIAHALGGMGLILIGRMIIIQYIP